MGIQLGIQLGIQKKVNIVQHKPAKQLKICKKLENNKIQAHEKQNKKNIKSAKAFHYQHFMVKVT
jgi:hypothetical protein